jgi:hypothetical protein
MTEGKTIRPEVVMALLPREARPVAASKKKAAPKQKSAAAGRKK